MSPITRHLSWATGMITATKATLMSSMIPLSLTNMLTCLPQNSRAMIRPAAGTFWGICSILDWRGRKGGQTFFHPLFATIPSGAILVESMARAFYVLTAKTIFQEGIQDTGAKLLS